MLKWFILYGLLLCSLFPARLNAQYPNLVFNKLTVQEGLPENNIQGLIQDKPGYIWMGTQAGIVRYDGYKAKVYNFGKENALDASTLTIFEDQSGRIWAGTAFMGLLYYDRATDHFKPYQPASGNTISNNAIVQILDDGKNDLMIISANLNSKIYSLDRINLTTGKIANYGVGQKGNHHINATIFIDMMVTKKGETWLATNNGFYNYDSAKDAFTGHFNTTDSTKQRRFSSLLEDPLQPGVLWMCQSNDIKLALRFRYASNEGVLQYNSNNNISTHYRHADNGSSIGNDSIFDIKKNQQNRLLFATAYGLSLFNPAQKNFTNYKLPVRDINLQTDYITIQPDNKGNIWYGGRTGIEYFDTHTQHFINFGNREKLPAAFNAGGRLKQFFIDRNNTVWMGADRQGLYWINQKASSFTLIKKDISRPAGYPGGGAHGFSQAKDHSIWMANANGFYHWFPQADSFVLLQLDPSVNKLYGQSILLDSKGRLWCGTIDNGLYLHDPGTKKTLHYIFNDKDSNSVSSNKVQTIYEDSQNRIWIGTWGGGLCLWRSETNNFKRYPYIKSVNTGNALKNGELDDDLVHLIYEDASHTIWVGTNLGAINSLDESTNRFTSWYNQPPGFVCIVSALSTDSGNYYIGTYMDGLFLFDTKTSKAKKITEKDGLLYNGAWQLLRDDDHNIWAASPRGFTIIDAKTKQFRNISRLNGFPETTVSLSNVNVKTSGGKFMIGFGDGILVFDPADFKPDSIAPLLHIEQLSFSNPLNEKKEGDSVVILYGKKEIRLSYDENKVSFFYTALSYQDAAFNQYSVWLDGFEKNWVDMGTQRVATYNNLAPGTYTFHVKASNSDGVWTSTDETIIVIISPPWWRTWWAYLLYIVAFVFAIWAYNRYRMAGIKREKEVLENKVTDRTTRLKQSNEELKSIQAHLEMQSLRAQLNPHFMFNSLNAIQELILMEENDKSHSYLARFSKLLRLLLENTEKPFIPLQREIDFIQLYLSLENLRIPELQFSVTVDPAIDTEQTSIPNMILQPYIENAIWHGLSHKPTDKKLQIRISKTNGAIQYEIEDNGVGRKKSAELKSLFRKEHKSKGMELLSKRFKLLSKELGADIVTSYEDVMNNGEVAGTLVTIKVPINFSEGIKDHTTTIETA